MATKVGSSPAIGIGCLRGCCPVCGWDFALRANGVMRAHWDESGAWCDGSGRTDPFNVRTVQPRRRIGA